MSYVLHLTDTFWTEESSAQSRLMLKKLLLSHLLVKAHIAPICFLENTIQLIRLRVERKKKSEVSTIKFQKEVRKN